VLAMKRYAPIPVLAAALAVAAVSAPQPERPPIASNPVVTVEGTVKTVRIAAAQGMPYVELSSGGETVKVFLGPVRFLMEQGFNPKAGTLLAVKGYKASAGVVAISITIDKKTLKLRDEDGWPVWRGGMMGRGPGSRSGIALACWQEGISTSSTWRSARDGSA
jgi:hypothetical protein